MNTWRRQRKLWSDLGTLRVVVSGMSSLTWRQTQGSNEVIGSGNLLLVQGSNATVLFGRRLGMLGSPSGVLGFRILTEADSRKGGREYL